MNVTSDLHNDAVTVYTKLKFILWTAKISRKQENLMAALIFLRIPRLCYSWSQWVTMSYQKAHHFTLVRWTKDLLKAALKAYISE